MSMYNRRVDESSSEVNGRAKSDREKQVSYDPHEATSTHGNTDTGPGTLADDLLPECAARGRVVDLGVGVRPGAQARRERHLLGLVHLSQQRARNLGVVNDRFTVSCQSARGSVRSRDNAPPRALPTLSPTGPATRRTAAEVCSRAFWAFSTAFWTCGFWAGEEEEDELKRAFRAGWRRERRAERMAVV